MSFAQLAISFTLLLSPLPVLSPLLSLSLSLSLSPFLSRLLSSALLSVCHVGTTVSRCHQLQQSAARLHILGPSKFLLMALLLVASVGSVISSCCWHCHQRWHCRLTLSSALLPVTSVFIVASRCCQLPIVAGHVALLLELLPIVADRLAWSSRVVVGIVADCC
jgi:hypothetical protein